MLNIKEKIDGIVVIQTINDKNDQIILEEEDLMSVFIKLEKIEHNLLNDSLKDVRLLTVSDTGIVNMSILKFYQLNKKFIKNESTIKQ